MLLHLGTVIFVSHISIFWAQADFFLNFHSPRPGAVLFNSGFNEQVFLLNPRTKFGTDLSCRFREKRKKRTFNAEK